MLCSSVVNMQVRPTICAIRFIPLIEIFGQVEEQVLLFEK
jgi:hypothetical protein